MKVNFWRCERCQRVRLPSDVAATIRVEEAPTRVVTVGGEVLRRNVSSYVLCSRCVRELSDEANDR